MSENKSNEIQEECFYHLCTKHTTCKGYVTYGKWKSRQSSIQCCLITIILSCVFISVILPLLIYSLVDSGINEEVVIDSTSATNYEAWSTNAYGAGYDDIKVKYKLYFFDLQNPVETLSAAQPVVVEVGPYVYDEYFIKFDIEWSDGGDTVAYNNQRFYIFNQADTGPGLTADDYITLPYPAVIGFQFFLNQIPSQLNDALDDALYEQVAAKQAQAIAVVNQAYAATAGLGPALQRQLQAQIEEANATLQVLFTKTYHFIDISSPTKLLLKTILCSATSEVSPFFQVKPGDAWFGYLNDTVLYSVQLIIDGISAKYGIPIPWSSAIPGPSINWTSIPDTRRRRNRDVFKTGKKNVKQVSQYVTYQNMTILRTCVESYKNPSTPYVEGEEWPACPYYYQSWDDNEDAIEANGYAVPWATDYASRIEGTDATMFGRPVTSDKLQVFISDIYRSAYLHHTMNTNWYSMPVKRYEIQEKDLDNVTLNPANSIYYSNGPSGMLNTTKAAGVPVFVSFPHFLYGDSRLVAAVKGMNPNPDLHKCYLDIEPQTGLLARARKRLQVNYLMESYSLPQIQDNSSEVAYATCLSLNQTIEDINTNLIIAQKTNLTIPYLQCGKVGLQSLLDCLSIPSEWKLKNDAIYFPYGWTSEELDLPESDADDLHELLYGTDEIAVQISFWCLVIAGICTAILLGMLIHSYLLSREYKLLGGDSTYQDYKYQQQPLLSQTEPLQFAFNPESNANNTSNTVTNPRYDSKKPQDSYSFSS